MNDGSSDNSLALIQELQERDSRIAYLDLSRNYGKEIAMCVGIDYIRGDVLVIIDADLQQPPELILTMYEELQKGYDDVYALRLIRKGETWFKTSRISGSKRRRYIMKASRVLPAKRNGVC